MAGAVHLKVTTLGGIATSSGTYSFVAPVPTITSFTPTSGTTSGGTTVSIRGLACSAPPPSPSGQQRRPASPCVPDNGAAVPAAHVAGTATVKVTTAGGTATAPGVYTFVAPIPTITSLTPAAGPASGGLQSPSTGAGLYGATSVAFGSTTAQSFTVVTPTKIGPRPRPTSPEPSK